MLHGCLNKQTFSKEGLHGKVLLYLIFSLFQGVYKKSENEFNYLIKQKLKYLKIFNYHSSVVTGLTTINEVQLFFQKR